MSNYTFGIRVPEQLPRLKLCEHIYTYKITTIVDPAQTYFCMTCKATWTDAYRYQMR